MKSLRLAFLADANSSHTQKWVSSLSKQGVEVHLLSLVASTDPTYYERVNVKVYSLGLNDSFVHGTTNDRRKLKYFLLVPKLRKIIREINPDIVHGHYATSYGALAMLSGSNPWVLSLWGDDVLIFPHKSFIHRLYLKLILWMANDIFSTSLVLKQASEKLVQREVVTIPFGVDTDHFHVQRDRREKRDKIVIGTVKGLEVIYGIDLLLKSCAQIKQKFPHQVFEFLIVGGGSETENLRKLSHELGIAGDCRFVGRVSHGETLDYFKEIDIFVALSRSESFGVAVLEAQSCQIPVVVSRVGGLPEIVQDQKTGFIVESESVDQAVEGIAALVNDATLRKELGANGRSFVQDSYSWDHSVRMMMEQYDILLYPSKRKVDQLLIHRESVKRIFSSFNFLISERVVKIIVGLYIHAAMARYLGVAHFGKLSYIINYVTIFLPFVTFGLDDVLPKYLLNSQSQNDRIVTTQIKFRMCSALVGYLLLSLFVIFDSGFELNYKLMLLIYGFVLFFRVFDVIEIAYQTALRMKPVFWARNLSYLSSSILKQIGILTSSNVQFFLFSYIWEIFSWKLINIFSFFKRVPQSIYDRAHVKSFFKEALPYFLGAFIILLDSKLGHVTLKKLVSDSAVGNFSISMMLIELWYFLPSALCVSLYPAIINAKQGLSGSYENRLTVLYGLLIWVSFLFIAALSIAAPTVVSILYGDRFSELSAYLMRTSWLSLSGFLLFARMKFYSLESKPWTWVGISLSGLLINLVLQMLFIHQDGVNGVLNAMIVSPFLAMVVLLPFSSTLRNELGFIWGGFLLPFQYIIKKK